MTRLQVHSLGAFRIITDIYQMFTVCQATVLSVYMYFILVINDEKKYRDPFPHFSNEETMLRVTRSR